jgi:nucleoside-diphosphate-sugar epimerase
MLKALAGLNFRDAAPRALVDLLIVQVAALLSLIYVLGQVSALPQGDGMKLLALLREYYVHIFLPLSWLFPMVFLLRGLYSHSRAYRPAYKWRLIAESCLIGTAAYVLVNFLLTRAALLPRGALLIFGVLVTCGTVGVRWLRQWLYETSPSAGVAVTGSPDDRVLVVGGAGYIGSVLVTHLLGRGHRVRVLDSLVYGQESLRGIWDHPNLELIVGDCRNIQAVVNAVKGSSAIVHLAAIVGDPACERDRPGALEVNYAATRMMIEIAKGYGVGRFVFASSCSVYGASEMLMDEEGRLNAVSLYAQTKVESEKALLTAATPAFHPTILRFATVFGHSYRPRFDLVVNLLTARAKRHGIITLYNSEQWRPFVHTKDVARAVRMTLDAPTSSVSGEVFNVGDAKLNCTLAEVGTRIKALIPGTRIERVDNADRRNYRVAFDKIRNRLGFECRVTLEEGILEIASALEGDAIGDFTDARYSNSGGWTQINEVRVASELDAEVMAAFARPARSWRAFGAARAETPGGFEKMSRTDPIPSPAVAANS